MKEQENSDQPQVSIVIPCYNEEEAIGRVIDDIRAAMENDPHTYEIIVVDDCSTDRTTEVARSKDVTVVRRAVNGGSGASRRTGILEARGNLIVMLDGDGTYHAPDIPKLLQEFPKFDQVNGARTSEEGTLKLLRVPAKWFIRRLAIYLSGTHIPDLNTGLKAFKRDVMLKYLWVIPDGFSCVTTMTLAFLCNGHAVKWIPTTYHKRIGQSKFHPIKDTSKYLFTVIRMVMYFNPLKVFLPLGFLLMLLGGGLGLWHYLRPMKGTLEQGDITIILVGGMTCVVGLLADLIVAQGRARNNPHD
ncbi:MAG: glycosyltransferase family 2 protein [bacterium]